MRRVITRHCPKSNVSDGTRVANIAGAVLTVCCLLVMEAMILKKIRVIMYGHVVARKVSKRTAIERREVQHQDGACAICVTESDNRTGFSLSTSGSLDSLRAGRSGDRIPVEARVSAPVQTGPGAHQASCTMGTGSFPGVMRSSAEV